MNAYRFVVFSPGVAPTTEEMTRFVAFRELLERQVAYGVRRRDGALAICFGAEPFELLRARDPAFDDLLLKWRVRGAEVVESLPFSRLDEPWRRLLPRESPPTKPWPPLPEPDDRPAEAKLLDATESEGRGRIAVEDAAEQGRRYERLGRWLPYAFGATAGVAVIGAGFWIGLRLLAAPVERRADTIRRVVADPIASDLARQPASGPVRDGAEESVVP